MWAISSACSRRQRLAVDSTFEKDWQEDRAAAGNIVPLSTGAAKAVAEVVASSQSWRSECRQLTCPPWTSGAGFFKNLREMLVKYGSMASGINQVCNIAEEHGDVCKPIAASDTSVSSSTDDDSSSS